MTVMFHQFNLFLRRYSDISIFLIFMLINLVTSRLIIIFCLTIILIVAFSIITKDLTKTLWIVTIVALFNYVARYFINPYTTPISGPIIAAQEYHISLVDLLLVCLLYRLYRIKIRIPPLPPIMVASLLCLYILAIVSSLISNYTLTSWFYTYQLARLIIMFLLSFVLVVSAGYSKLTLRLIIYFVALNSLLMILQKMHGSPLGLIIEDTFTVYGSFAQESQSLYRPGGMFWDPNKAASLINMGFFIIFPLWLKRKYLFNFVSDSFILITALISLIISASRGNWLVFIVLSLIALGFHLSSSKKITINSANLKITLIVIIAFIFIVGPFLFNRFLQFNSSFGRSTILTRLQHIEIAKDLTLQYPFGVGLNTFQFQIMQTYLPKYYLFDSTPAHNVFAEISADLGLLGLLSYIFFIYALIRPLINKIQLHQPVNYITFALLFSALSYLLSSQMYPLLFSIPISDIFWIILGAFYGSFNQKTQPV